jgi:catechol 2,3-dioxygenase-like lactoylglutathione lyase family enzyme
MATLAALRHVAICTKDPFGTAEFYDRMFGLKIVDVQEVDDGTFVYCSDGVVTLALLDYKSDEAARSVRIDGTGFVGLHHIGFLEEDPEAKIEFVRQQHGTVVDRPVQEGAYFEYKILDPNGIVVDMARKWPGISVGDEADADRVSGASASEIRTDRADGEHGAAS